LNRNRIRLLSLGASLCVVVSGFSPGPALATSVHSLRGALPGELAIVAVNARQHRADADDARLRSLVAGLRSRGIDPSDGMAVAPDVLVVSELAPRQARDLERRLNATYGAGFDCSSSTTPCPFALAATDVRVQADVIVNTKTVSVLATTTWRDVCKPTASFEVARLLQTSTDTPFTVAGIHLLPTYSTPIDCRRLNIDALRAQLSGIAGPVFAAGDFNKRTVKTPHECDPEEQTHRLAWWKSMTAASPGDVAYRDSVRSYRRGRSLSMARQWTHEQPMTLRLCDGKVSHKRGRIDYVFHSAGVKTLDAHVDTPGWAVEGKPGATNCPPKTPSCKYSDHRFVWTRFRIAVGLP
jgi:endonuclease/exonuclease/phosphatase family metal-dependent hydrolase